MPQRILIDTGIIFSMINKRERDTNRGNALKFAKKIKEKQISPIITDYIVDELLTRIVTRLSIKEAIKVRDFIDSGYFEFHKIDEDEYNETMRDFFNYNRNRKGKKCLSFTDCSNAVASNKIGVNYIASFDPHHDVFQGRNIYRIEDPTWLS